MNTERWDNQNLIPNYFMQNISWSNFSKSPQISMHFILTVRVKLRGFGKVTSICFYSLAHRMLTNRRGQFFGNVSSQLINSSFWRKKIFLLFRPHLPKQLLYLEIHWSQIHWSSGILTCGKNCGKPLELKHWNSCNIQMPSLPPFLFGARCLPSLLCPLGFSGKHPGRPNGFPEHGGAERMYRSFHFLRFFFH